MVFVAAGLAGLGGLLLQLVLVRRHGLLLGNTAEAAALVLALFLLGLGLGGLYGPRLPVARRRPLGSAAVAYALVALTAVTADGLLARMAPVGWLSGVVLALLAPGLPTLCMGAAFPLLFSTLPPGSHPVPTADHVRPFHLAMLCASTSPASLKHPATNRLGPVPSSNTVIALTLGSSKIAGL